MHYCQLSAKSLPAFAVQAYPSRTKDLTEVDFSTGSVGMSTAITTFAALTETYLRSHGLCPKAWPGTSEVPVRPGRQISVIGDAEMDEGNVFEALLESWKLDVSNTWCVVDFNRQSLDKNLKEGTHRLHERLFRLSGWYGRHAAKSSARAGQCAARPLTNRYSPFPSPTLYVGT